MRRAQAMAPRSPFAGLVVRLVGFTDEQEAYYKNAVEENGGTITTGYKILGTHVVACSETTCCDDPICVKARSKGFGCAVVNEFWLDDAINAIDEGHLPDHDIVTYKVPQSLKGICCLPILRISVAGYDGRETLHLKRIGALIGATFYDQFEEDKLTHLICKSPNSKEYEKAKIVGIPVVRETWIEEYLHKWKMVPLEMHLDFSFKSHSSIPTHSGLKSFHTPSQDKSNHTHMPATTGHIYDRPPSYIERPNSGARRVLEYPQSDLMSVSRYLKTINLTCAVKVPRYPFPETLANLDVKSILLKAFGLVHDEHLEDQSLSGLYSFSDFILSIKSKSVKLQKIARFSLTKVSKQTDMDRFADCCEEAFGGKAQVPTEVRVWLQCMRNGVDGFVLRRHINMVDPSETFSTFITLYDAFVGLSSYEQMCMKNMKEYKDWIDYHLRWVVLEESLDAKKVQVKSKEEEKARAAGRNGSAVARDAYTRDFRGLVPFIRDSFVHPAKDYKVYMIAVMMIEFRDFLANLQEELYLLGKLPALKH